MFVTYETVKEYLDRNEVEGGHNSRASFVLTSNDTAWNPGSTKDSIVGPGRITYIRYPDGGVQARLTD